MEPLIFHGSDNLLAQSRGSQHFWFAGTGLEPSKPDLDLGLLGFAHSVHVYETFVNFFSTSQHFFGGYMQIIETHIFLQFIVRARLVKVGRLMHNYMAHLVCKQALVRVQDSKSRRDLKSHTVYILLQVELFIDLVLHFLHQF